MAEPKKTRNYYRKWLVLLLVIFLLLSIMLASGVLWLETKYQDKFYPGLKLAGVNLGGLTQPQAQKIFSAKIEEFNREGQNFFYQNKKITLSPVVIATADPDLSYELINLNFHNTLTKIYELGRGKNFLDKFWQKIRLIFLPKNYSLQVNLNETAIKKILSDNFQSYEKNGRNPAVKFTADKLGFIPEQIGLNFNYGQALKQLNLNLQNLAWEPIELKLIITEPNFKISDTQFLWPEIEKIIGISNISFTATTTEANKIVQKIWPISQTELKKWLDFSWDSEEKKPILIFEPLAVSETLKNLNTGLEKPVREAKFVIANNKVEQFQTSSPGIAIDLEATIKNLTQKIIIQKNNSAEIVTHSQEPVVTTENVNQLGIKELLGAGESSYLNSPANRRHNIKTGAAAISGILIKPGDEFSLNNALGDITADKGYLPELVIKGNKTMPEYGGGLCQIATTMFRLAVNAGLKITERKPHAYRVSYYEPAGSDATIYSPHPDLRFINDTPNYLLLQTNVDETLSQLRFEFFGTSDNRQTITTAPRIFNIVPPGETKYIETTDLPPQKIKCTEIAHSGADAEFTRTIIWPDGKKQKDIFQSHYRPWQAVCLVGIDPNKKTTSTDEIINN